MSDKSCLFCKIINKSLFCFIVKENEDFLVIKDINPKAPIHYLIIPKKHVQDVSYLDVNKDEKIASGIVFMAKSLSSIDEKHKSFRLISNNGSSSGQSVFHMHFHFMAGKIMSFEC